MLIPFPEYAPDLSPYPSQASQLIQNVLPRKDGYGPIPSPSVYSDALSAACRGFFRARNADGSITIFAATSTKLWKLNNTDFSWTDVSKGSSTYTAIPSTDQWQFSQFNNFVIAVQINTVPQVFDLTSSTNFDDLAGSPPQARYVAVVNRFLVLSGLGTTQPYRIQWSGLDATTTWTSGVNQSDFQDLPDGGIVRGVAGGETGIIMQDSAIRRMTFAPGSPVVFQIERIAQDKGIYAPLSLVRGGDRLFFCGNDGFQVIATGIGGYPQPIGKEKVDRTFFADVDSSNLQLMIGAYEPRATRVYWAYKSISGTTGLFDKILIYDWILDKWAVAIISGEYISNAARPGLTLESLDSISGSLDALPFSLDDVSTATIEYIAAFDSAHKLNFITGTPLEAILETSDYSQDNGRRIRVKGFRPDTDASSCYGKLLYRETVQASTSSTSETAISSNGEVFTNLSTRLARARIRIPSGATWTFAAGVEPFAGVEGKF